MDRRQQKTRKAIFKAFSRLLETKRYENITVQEIIDEADVGRSTFYAHFETKDHLLKAMCSDIFDHIFAGNVCEYTEKTEDMNSRLAHILWHLHDHKSDVMGILSSESKDIFMGYLKEYLTILFKIYLEDFKTDIPKDFLLNFLIGSFSETIFWWVKNKMDIPSEDVAKYYTKMILKEAI